jgi:hypothetical protein
MLKPTNLKLYQKVSDTERFVSEPFCFIVQPPCRRHSVL